jgi:hypothetical protein
LGCGGGDDEEPAGETPSDAKEVEGDALVLTSLVDKPAKDAEAQTAFEGRDEYTGTVGWKDGAGETHTGVFAAGTVYTAVVTLKAETGYVFVAANDFVHANAYSVEKSGFSTTGVTVTIVFPITAAEDGGPNPVPAAATVLSAAQVPVPKKGEEARTVFAATEWYTGKIEWKDSKGDLHTGAFKANEAYTATVTLAAAENRSFANVGPDTFAYGGEGMATNTQGTAEEVVVTILFGKTEGEPGNETIVYALDLASAFTAPVTGAEAVNTFTAPSAAQYGGTLAWKDSADADVAAGTKFAGNADYKAVAALKATENFTFKGAGDFTYGTLNGEKSGASDDGKEITVTFVFHTDTVVNGAALNLAAALAVPVTGDKPVIAFTAPDVTQYTGGDAVWTSALAEDGTFAAATAYTAEVTLKTAGDYTFATLGAAAFSSVAGAVTAFDAETGVVKVTFAKTAATVDALALAGVLDKPSKNQKPQLTLNGDQYTGTVAWKNIDGSNFTGTAFAAATPYKAVVTLTAKQPSFTFYGFTADFGYSGAAKVDPTAVVDVNTATVAIEFGNTEASETTVALEFNPIRVTSSTGSLEGIVLTKGGTTPTTVTLTVSSVTSEFPITSPKWYVDGNPTAVTATNQGFTLVLSSAAAYSTVRDNAHSVTVTGNAASKPYSFEVPFTVKAAAN